MLEGEHKVLTQKVVLGGPHQVLMLEVVLGWTDKEWKTTARPQITTAEAGGAQKGLKATMLLAWTDKESITMALGRTTTAVATLKAKVRVMTGPAEPPQADLMWTAVTAPPEVVRTIRDRSELVRRAMVASPINNVECAKGDSADVFLFHGGSRFQGAS